MFGLAGLLKGIEWQLVDIHQINIEYVDNIIFKLRNNYDKNRI